MIRNFMKWQSVSVHFPLNPGMLEAPCWNCLIMFCSPPIPPAREGGREGERERGREGGREGGRERNDKSMKRKYTVKPL